MPGHALADLRRLLQQVAGEHSDVRSDQRLYQRQYLVGKEKLKQAGVAPVRAVYQRGGDASRPLCVLGELARGEPLQRFK